MTYRLHVVRKGGTTDVEQSLSAAGVSRRLLELVSEPGVLVVHVWTGSTLIASIEPPLPPRQGPPTRAQMHARSLDADAKLGFTRD